MDLPAGVDAYAVLDELLEVIFADEDFFEDAFAAVMASWNAPPPGAPAKTTPGARPAHQGRSEGARQLGQGPVRAPTRQASQLRTARSPPGAQPPWGHEDRAVALGRAFPYGSPTIDPDRHLAGGRRDELVVRFRDEGRARRRG
jgi:hypothetical protein